MQKKKMILILSVSVIVLLVVNIILLSARIISELVFWAVVVIGFILSKIILKMNNVQVM